MQGRFRFGILAVAAVMTLAAVASAQTPLAPMRATPANVAPGDRPVAQVNGSVLTERDLQRTIRAIFPYTDQHNGLPKGMGPEIRKGALDMVIFDELVYQEARRRNLQIPVARLNRAMADFRRQFSSEEEYREFLRVECEGSERMAREKIRRSMLIEAFMKREVARLATVTAADAKTYYDQNPQQFETKETLHIQTISIIPPPNAGPKVQEEARGHAENALRNAKGTRSYREFGLLAEKVSDDDWRVNMGDRKPMEAEKLPPPIVEAARKMKPGDVSEVFQFGPNYTLFRLHAYTPAGKRSFVTVKTQLLAELQKVKYERLRSELHKKLRQNASVQVW